LYPGMWECVGQIPAKLGCDEKLLNKKSGKWSQNWDHTISDGRHIVNPILSVPRLCTYKGRRNLGPFLNSTTKKNPFVCTFTYK
jgi:hypothetical protein